MSKLSVLACALACVLALSACAPSATPRSNGTGSQTARTDGFEGDWTRYRDPNGAGSSLLVLEADGSGRVQQSSNESQKTTAAEVDWVFSNGTLKLSFADGVVESYRIKPIDGSAIELIAIGKPTVDLTGSWRRAND